MHPKTYTKKSFIDCFHTRAKCVIWIWIRNAHFELKFKRRYFGPCVRQITSRCIIWNAHFKWRSGGVFKLRISQITQWNHSMNALTSKSWFGGGAKWPSNWLPPIYRALHMYRSTGNASSVHVWLAGYPDILLPLECKIPNSVSHVYTA